MDQFQDSLQAQWLNKRQATKLRDYVLSVWVDCPGYEIPNDFATLSLAGLLDNALRQKERNHGLTVATLAVSGLFDGCERTSITWDPTKYLDSQEVLSSADVYGTVYSGGLHAIFLPVESPVCLQFKLDIPLSKIAQEYSSVFASEDSATVGISLDPIFQNWSEFSYRRCSEYISELFRENRLQEHDFHQFIAWTLDKRMNAGAFVARDAWIKSLTASVIEANVASEAEVHATIQKRIGTFV